MTDRKRQPEAIDPENAARRAFTQQAILALLSGVTVTITACGDSDSPTSPSPGEDDVRGSVSANHGHAAVIESARLTGTSAVTLDIRGTATHPHTVELSS